VLTAVEGPPALSGTNNPVTNGRRISIFWSVKIADLVGVVIALVSPPLVGPDILEYHLKDV
jgi:hypothetical protein